MKSPFKFLDAYDRQDKEIFFGRAEEIEQLYKLIFQTNLVLVYGQSGTGKTSLIQCGLANRFKPTDWFELFVRRKDDINISLHREIRRYAETSIADEATVAEAIQSLYLDHLRPVYLIFDQFEELFILGTAQEQEKFINSIAELLKSNVACKIIFVMREEYIAKLYNFEKVVPALFNKRFRVESMNQQNLLRVITETCKAPEFNIILEQGEETARQITNNIRDPRAGVQLSYLQVYLDKLYREAVKAQNGHALEGSTEGKTLTFTEKLVEETGKLEDVLENFLDEQTAAIQKKLAAQFPQAPAEAVQLILEEFVSVEDTKQPMTQKELLEKLKERQSPLLVRRLHAVPSSPGFRELEFDAPILEPGLSELENSRILRKIDEVYELAHDSLAGRIAGKRSAERKNLLKVEKVLKDRLSAYEQTRIFLNKEELNYIAPYLEKLRLSPDLSNFIQKSVDAAKRKTRILIVTVFSIIVVVVGFAGFAVWQWQEAKDNETLAQKLQKDAEEAAHAARRMAYQADSVATLMSHTLVKLQQQLDRAANSDFTIVEGDKLLRIKDEEIKVLTSKIDSLMKIVGRH